MLKETQACNDFVCNEPVDCVYGSWGYWGECSASCDGGQAERTREVETLAAYGGKVRNLRWKIS